MSECASVVPMLGSRPGELPPADEARLHAHLAGCEACQCRLADAAAVGGLVLEGVRREANGVDFARFADEVMAKAYPPTVVERLRRRRVALVAALAPALAVAAAILIYIRAPHGSTAQPVAQAGDAEIVSEGHEPFVMETSDGPVVLLGDDNSDT